MPFSCLHSVAPQEMQRYSKAVYWNSIEPAARNKLLHVVEMMGRAAAGVEYCTAVEVE